MPEPISTLALPENLDPKTVQQIRVILPAILVSLGVQDLAPDFKERRDELTAVAYEYTQPPEDDTQQQEILDACRPITKLRTELTKNGESFKAPLNSARTTIIDLVKDAVATLQKAEDHLNGLVQSRQRKLLEEQRQRDEAARKQNEEIERQRQQAEREQQEAERKRQEAALASQRAQEATTAAARKKAEQEAAKLKADAEALETAAMEKNLAVENTAPATATPVSDHTLAKQLLDFELEGKDEKASLIKLLTAHPELFKATVRDRTFSLTLQVKNLTDALNGNAGFTKIDGAPGIRVITKITNLR